MIRYQEFTSEDASTYSDFINLIISSRGRFGLPREEYKERHHIIPRCMGGNSDENNLIDLTAREHFIAHRFLYEESKGTEYCSKLACAMKFSSTQFNENGKVKLTEDEYKYLKEVQAKIQSERMKGKPKSKEHCKKISEAKKGCTLSEETKAKIRETKAKNGTGIGEKNGMYGVHRYGEESPNYGKHIYTNGVEDRFFYPDEVPKGFYRGRSKYNRTVPVSEETIRKFKETVKGRHWYTNGEIDILSHNCPDGFSPGRKGGWKWKEKQNGHD